MLNLSEVVDEHQFYSVTCTLVCFLQDFFSVAISLKANSYSVTSLIFLSFSTSTVSWIPNYSQLFLSTMCNFVVVSIMGHKPIRKFHINQESRSTRDCITRFVENFMTLNTISRVLALYACNYCKAIFIKMRSTLNATLDFLKRIQGEKSRWN